MQEILDHRRFVFALQRVARQAAERGMTQREFLSTPLMRLGGGPRLLHAPEARSILAAMEPAARTAPVCVRFDVQRHRRSGGRKPRKKRVRPPSPARRRAPRRRVAPPPPSEG